MRYALAALALSATAAHANCIHVESAFHKMEEGGYQITFGQSSDSGGFFIAQNENREWIAFVVRDQEACILARGNKSINYPLPPNV